MGLLTIFFICSAVLQLFSFLFYFLHDSIEHKHEKFVCILMHGPPKELVEFLDLVYEGAGSDCSPLFWMGRDVKK
jgi:hypothetical protein